LTEDAEPIGEVSREPLYSPMQIAASTLLGGVLAGFALMAVNYGRVGRWPAAVLVATAGLLAMLAQLVLLFSLPAGFPAVALYLPLMLSMFGLAQGLQGRIFARQLASGGPLAQGWEPILLPIACLAMTAGAAGIYLCVAR
jgi:hypothetical protein